jgi:hypothetical protein
MIRSGPGVSMGNNHAGQQVVKCKCTETQASTWHFGHPPIYFPVIYYSKKGTVFAPTLTGAFPEAERADICHKEKNVFMKKITFLIVISLIASSHTFAQISLKKLRERAATVASGATPLSESEIARGLREALTVGSRNAASQLNKQDGFLLNPKVRIPFPEDAQRVATKLREMGFGKKVDEFELTLNRAAEDAAKEAAPIFVNAITSMTITDAKNILTGPDNAATSYLQGRTSDPLGQAFSPHIKKALDATSATRLWGELTTLYNRIPLVKKVETNLTKYTTDKALKGMFLVVAEEELKIRKDPAARVSDILKRVFGGSAS